ncbi:hypothetical protein CTheo_4028 [Ceratobasidium theobromae]|uniref:Uncharacterized protein n=1 Tax=Ceratobasidium theobromae TaxID=1582974 RepID=A0A5N5QM22_9AGAM|nr:hypothetical protein CTheo_4028 [Ceratobasidium theobromae]
MPTASFLSNNKDSSEWATENLSAQFSELTSVPNHPALAHIPPPSSFPQTRWFLNAANTRQAWIEGDLTGGVEWLALKLDKDWPEWAANTTNVLGLLLSDLFADFYPWLRNLRVNRLSVMSTVTLRFEQQLFAQAQLRHTWDWWKLNYKTNPRVCFRPSLVGANRKITIAGHPVDKTMKLPCSWREYYERVSKEARYGEKMTEGDWVVVE